MIGFLRHLFKRKGFRAYPLNRALIRYIEDGRKMDIAGEMLSDGFVVYLSNNCLEQQFW